MSPVARSERMAEPEKLPTVEFPCEIVNKDVKYKHNKKGRVEVNDAIN